MSINLPKTIFGIDTAQALERILATPSPPQEKPGQAATHITNPQGYILIPGTTKLIAKQESYKGKTWEDTHYLLSEQGLFMPSPAIFMPYVLAVQQAAQGRIVLYDGNHNPLQQSEAHDLWNYLSSTDRQRGTCWTHLDAKFEETNNKWTLITDHRVVMNNGKKELQGTTSPLEECLREDNLVTLQFNHQGLPTTSSPTPVCRQGANLYYYHPRNNAVARFFADADGAVLSCLGGPQYSYSRLGVFACAEGTPQT